MPRMVGMRFSEKLIKLCDAKGWLQSDLWRAVGRVSRTTVSSWFNDNSRPDMDTALLVARALRVPLDYLADDSQDEPPAGLPDDEIAVLNQYRSLKVTGLIDQDRAMAGLAVATRFPPGQTSITDTSPKHLGTAELTQSALRREREQNRPVRKEPSPGNGHTESLGDDVRSEVAKKPPRRKGRT